MGYWAAGDGSITIKKEIRESSKADEIVNEIESKLKALDLDIEYEITGADHIDFWENDTHWHEEDTYEFLNVLIPYSEDGCANYSSREDDSVWRYVLENGKWVEECATIDYDFESYTDEQLIEELAKRGYNIEGLSKEDDMDR